MPNRNCIRFKRQRGSVVLTLILMLSSGATSLSVGGAQFRQARLDLQLLSAIRSNDLPGAKSALKLGASSNAAEYDHPPLQTVMPTHGLRGFFEKEPPKSTAVGLAAAWLGSYRDDMDFEKSSVHKDVQDNKQIMSLLLNSGADLNRQDINGNTPIIIAVGNGNREAARLLIRRHARLDIKGNYQRCSLGNWINEPAWEFPSPRHIMRSELRKIIEEGKQ